MRLRLLDHKELTWDLVATLLDFGAMHGFGRWRTGGYGVFTWAWIDAADAGEA